VSPPRPAKDPSVLRLQRSISDPAADPRHAGATDGADRVGSAAAAGERVLIGMWLDRMGRVEKARWTATPSESDALAAYAEVACTLLESGVAPGTVDASALRRTLDGVRPADERRADLVASAIASALGIAL
jgi:hypothetical protein